MREIGKGSGLNYTVYKEISESLVTSKAVVLIHVSQGADPPPINNLN
jgi:hypothetical protein